MLNRKLYRKAKKFVEKNVDRTGFLDFGNFTFFLTQCPSRGDYGEINGGPAEFKFQRDINGFEVQIWQNLRKPIKKAMLLHELIEVNAFYSNENEDKSHEIALKYESKYIREKLSGRDQVIYERLRERFC